METEAARLALRYQAGESGALKRLYRLVEVAILAVLLNEQAFRPRSAMTWEEMQKRSRRVLGELARQWQPGVSFLGFLSRTFPRAVARQMRGTALTPTLSQRERGQDLPSPIEGEGTAPAPSPSPIEGEGIAGQGPYTAEDLALLPELERQVLLLRVFEGQSMLGIARRVGVPEMAAYKLYYRARQRLKGRGQWAEDGDAMAMRRLVDALHVAAGRNGRLPGRGWTMAAAGLKQLEYNELIARLEAAGAIEGRGNRQGGWLVERDAGATVARVTGVRAPSP